MARINPSSRTFYTPEEEEERMAAPAPIPAEATTPGEGPRIRPDSPTTFNTPGDAVAGSPENNVYRAVRNAPKIPALQASHDLKMSKALDVNQDVVERNRDQILQASHESRIKDLTRGREALTELMSSHTNVSLAQDDVAQLASLEDFFNGKVNPEFSALTQEGSDVARLYRLRDEGLALGQDPDQAEREAVLRFAVGRGLGLTADMLKGVGGSVLRTAGKTVPTAVQMGFNFLGGAAGLLGANVKSLETWGLEGRGGYFDELRDEAFANADWIQKNIIESDLLSLPEELKKPLIDNPLLIANPEWLLSNVGEAANSLASILAIALATGGGSEVAAFAGGAAEGTSLYNDLLKDGVDENIALTASMAFGYAVTRLEKIGLGAILGKERVKTFGMAIAKALAKGSVEGLTEYLEEPIQGFIGAMARTGGNISASIDSAITALKNIDVIPGAMFAGGGLSYVSQFQPELQLSILAEENLQFFQAINAQVADVDLKDLAPERFKSYAQSISELPTVPDSVFIPVEELQKAAGEDFNALVELTGVSDQVETATAENGDIEIPMAEFMASIAGTDTALKLENDFRFSPGQMTPREAAEWQKDYMDVFAKDVARAAEVAEQINQENVEAAEVSDSINNTLLALGLPAAEAEANASIWAARATIASQGFTAAGQPMTPMQWLQSKNLAVRDEKTGATISLNVRQAAIDRTMEAKVFNQDQNDVSFEAWSKDAPVIEGADISYDSPGGGKVFKVSHGTTNAFTVFDPSIKGTKEGHFGAVNYFTSDKGDADINYAGRGQDLTNRIELRAEQIEQEMYDNPWDEMVEAYNIPDKFTEDSDVSEVAEFLADRELYGRAPNRMDVFVRLDNPVYLGGDAKTWIDVVNAEQFRDDATEDILFENDADIAQVDDFEDEIQDRMYEMADSADSPIEEAVTDAINDFDTGVNPAKVIEDLQLYGEDSITATELEDRLRASEELMYADDYETGENITSHIVGQVFKNLGFDGIVLQNADKRFPGMNMGSGTAHVHVFEETPSQIKDRSNITFDSRTGDVYQQDGQLVLNDNFYKWFGDSKVVDEEGQPKVMYHGTRKKDITEFHTFFPNFFTDSKEYARGYTDDTENVMEVYLSIQKPFDTRDPEALDLYNNEFLPWAKGKHKALDDGRYVPLQAGEAIPFTTADRVWSFLLNRKRTEDWDYDGMRVDERFGDNNISYVPLDNKQIKSTNNRGTWSSVDPNIYQQISDPTSKSYNQDGSFNSPVTLSVFNSPMLQNKEGRQINVQTVRQILNQKTTKQIEKQIVNAVLDSETFAGQKKIDFDMFKAAVDQELMPLDQITTTKWSDYGSEHVGVDPDTTESVVYNSPIQHGFGDHFSELFGRGVTNRVDYEIEQIPGRDMYVALEIGRPAGLSAEELEPYVGTAGSRERVEDWIEEYEKRDPVSSRAGVFGHTRRWPLDQDMYVAELQSDFYQKNTPEQGVIEAFKDAPENEKQEEIVRLYTPHKAVVDATPQNIKDDFKNAGGVARKMAAANRELKKLKKEQKKQEAAAAAKPKEPGPGQFKVYRTAPGSGPVPYSIVDGEPVQFEDIPDYKFFVHRTIEDDGWKVSEVQTGLGLGGEWATKEQAISKAQESLTQNKDKLPAAVNNFVETLGKRGAEPTTFDISVLEDKIDDLESEIDRHKARLKHLATRSDADAYEKYYNAMSALDKIYKKDLPKALNILQKQFLAHRKNYSERMIREEIRNAAKEGMVSLRMPTPHTLAAIEGYIESVGGTSYDVTRADNPDELEIGDEIEYEGEDYYVTEADYDEIYITPAHSFHSFSEDEWIDEEVYRTKEDVMYDLNSMMTLTDIETSNWYGPMSGSKLYEAIATHLTSLADNADLSSEEIEELIFNTDEVSDVIEDAIREEIEGQDILDSLQDAYYDGAVFERDGYYYVTTDSYETSLPQPGGGDGVTKEDFEITDLEPKYQGIVRQYAKHGEFLEKLSPETFRITEDDKEYEWYAIDVDAADAADPVILFQDPKKADPQGRITMTQNETLIELLKTANKSTFAHETAHLFLEDMKSLASLPGAPDQVKADYAAITEYLGVEGGEFSTQNHEDWARTFETYLREGKAPSRELQSAFRRFKTWLTRIYKTIIQLESQMGVQINDEIRGVMNRMLATEDMINEMESENRIEPVFKTAEEAGMDDAEFDEYLKAHNNVTERAKEILAARLFKDIKKRNTKYYKDKRNHVYAESREELLGRKNYRALFYIQNGFFPEERDDPPKGAKRTPMNTANIVEMGFVPGGLVKGVPPVYSSAKNSVHPDTLADMMGYSSGQALLTDFTGMPTLNQEAAKMTDTAMNEYEDLVSDEVAREQAQAALESEARVDLLALESELLQKDKDKEQNRINFAKRSREAAARAKVIKTAAAGAIGRMKTMDAGKVNKHIQAERRAAKEAQELALKMGPEKTQAQKDKLRGLKDRQMIAAALASEATKAKEEVEKTLNYLNKFKRAGVRKNLARDYLNQIDDLLAWYDLKKGVSYKEIEGRESLSEWVMRQENMGYEPDIPDFIKNKADKVSYKELSLDEFRGLRDSVKSIEKLARLKQRLLTARFNKDFQENVDNLVEVTTDFFGDKMGPSHIPRELEGKKNYLKKFESDLTKVEFMMNVLDGGKMNGAWWEMIYRPVNDGTNAKAERFAQIQKDLFNTGGRLFGRYTKKELNEMSSKKTYIEEIGESLTKEQIMAMALNRGNAYNWAAVYEGENWTEAQAESALAELTEKDWEVVAETWDYINSFWPEIKALYHRLSGVAPEKVQADSFVNPLGKTMKGGYYPVSFSSQLSVKASQREQAKNVQEMFGGNGIKPSTRNGFTKERTNTGQNRLALSLNVLVKHLDEVTQDLYLREAAIDVDRLLQNGQVQQTIRQALGQEQYDQLRPWLAGAVNDRAYDYDSMNKTMGFFRKNATMAMMGYKATVFFSQYAGLINVVPIISKNVKGGNLSVSVRLAENFRKSILGSYSSTGKFVEEKSSEMRDRRHNFVQEVTDMSKHFGFGRNIARWQESMMYFTSLADFHVSSAAWKTGYDMAINDGKTDQQAIDFADSVVRMSQGAGRAKDLSGVQRGSDTKKMWLMFFSYMNTNYNQLVSAGKIYKVNKRKGAFFGALAFYWFFPVIAAELLAGRGPDEDEETVVGWAAKSLVEHPVGMLPGVRDIYRAATDEYGRPVSLIGKVGVSLNKLQKTLGKDNIEIDDLFWSAVDAAGYFVPFPSGQFRITVRQVLEYANGERTDFDPVFYSKKN